MDWEGVDLGMGLDSEHRGGLHSSGPANQRQWSSEQRNNSGGRLKKGWFLPENMGFKEDLFKDLDNQIFKEAFVANQNVRDEMKRMRRSLINRFQANNRNHFYNNNNYFWNAILFGSLFVIYLEKWHRFSPLYGSRHDKIISVNQQPIIEEENEGLSDYDDDERPFVPKNLNDFDRLLQKMQRNRSEIKELQAMFDEVIKPSMEESKLNLPSLEVQKGETRFDSQTQEMQRLMFGKGHFH